MITQKHWAHFSHESDIGVRGYGPTLSEAFAMAGLALTHVITDSPIQALKKLHLSCEAPNLEILLMDWLNAIIYNMAIHKMLFSQFDVRIRGLQLTAIIVGESIDVARHQPAVEVKGATFTELKVYQDNDQWIAQCVVDV